MMWVTLAILAPFFWACSNFVDKYILEKYSKGTGDFLFFSAVTSWPFLFVLLFFVGIPELSVYSLIPILTGLVLIGSYGFYAKALEQGDTSTLVVLFKLIPVFTLVIAFVFLDQALSIRELLAFVIVLVGASVISIEKNGASYSFRKGLGWILAAILLWAIILTLSDFVLEKMSFWDFFVLDTLGSALAAPLILLFPSMRGTAIHGLRAVNIPKIFAFLANNLLDFLGQMSIKMSLSLASSAALVTVVMQTQSFFAILIGVILTLWLPHIIHEDITFKVLFHKICGAVLMFVGVSLLFF